MEFRHGVSTSEKPTSMIAPVTADAALPVVVGTAPINLASGEYLVNEPVLCYNYAEATQKLGFSKDFSSYTLCEAMYSQFALFGVAPIVFINVLDPEKHKKQSQQPIVFSDGKATIAQEGVLKETVKLTELKDADGQVVEKIDVSYVYDDDGYLNVFAENVNSATADFDVLDPEAVTADDIVGGVGIDGSYKGLELVSYVFPLFRLVPGTIICPKYSADSLVAAVMEAKSQYINGVFQAISIPDISTVEVTDYTKVAKHKNDNNIASTYQFAVWPKVSLGGKEMHLSTQLASLMGLVDAANEGVPYVSPSNKNLKMDSAVLEGGTPIVLGLDQANYLNGQGVVTTLNFIGGHKLWGNRTAAYPANSDAKDAFIPLRRMFNYIANSLVLTYWNKVDDPGNPKLIETVLRSINTWMDGLSAEGKILGGRVEFRKDLNPKTALLDGKFKFSIFLTPPTPAEDISFELELDVNYFDALFA